MNRTREYDWEDELPNGMRVSVGATITGHDTPWSYASLDPPEYREVEITVEIYPPNGHKFDITESLSEEFLDRMRDKAIEIEDDKLAAEYEDRMEHRHEVNLYGEEDSE